MTNPLEDPTLKVMHAQEEISHKLVQINKSQDENKIYQFKTTPECKKWETSANLTPLLKQHFPSRNFL